MVARRPPTCSGTSTNGGCTLGGVPDRAKLARGTAKRRAARCAKTRPGRERVGMTPVECGPSIFVVAGVQPDDYIVRKKG